MRRMCLAMVTADGERRFPIKGERVVLGRHTRCDLRVAVPSVSMRHCEIVVDGNELTLADLGSETGTFHNGARVKKAVLAANDTVTIGPVTFVVRTDGTGDSVTEMKPSSRTTTYPAGS